MRGLLIIFILLAFVPIANAQQKEVDCSKIYNSLNRYIDTQSSENAKRLNANFTGESGYYCIDSDKIRDQYFSTHSFILEKFMNNLSKFTKRLKAEDKEAFDLFINWYWYMSDGFYSEELIKTLGGIITDHPSYFLISLNTNYKLKPTLDTESIVLFTDENDKEKACTKIKQRGIAINGVKNKESAELKRKLSKAIDDYLVAYCK